MKRRRFPGISNLCLVFLAVCYSCGGGSQPADAPVSEEVEEVEVVCSSQQTVYDNAQKRVTTAEDAVAGLQRDVNSRSAAILSAQQTNPDEAVRLTGIQKTAEGKLQKARDETLVQAEESADKAKDALLACDPNAEVGE